MGSLSMDTASIFISGLCCFDRVDSPKADSSLPLPCCCGDRSLSLIRATTFAPIREWDLLVSVRCCPVTDGRTDGRTRWESMQPILWVVGAVFF